MFVFIILQWLNWEAEANLKSLRLNGCEVIKRLQASSEFFSILEFLIVSKFMRIIKKNNKS